MPEFQYIAKTMNGERTTGLVTADNESAVISTLSLRHLFPLKIELAESAKKQERHRGRKVKGRELANFYSQLADLLRSGVPLLRSLELLERQTRNQSLKLVLAEVRGSVSQGMRLAEAMRQHSRVFSELTVSMVRAGEEGSFMEDVLKRIAVITEQQEDMKDRVRGAMIYPAFLVLVGTSVITSMMVWFVPKFEPVFQRFEDRGGLPLITQAVVGISRGIGQYGPYLAVAIAAAVIFAGKYGLTEDGRRFFDKTKLTLPMVGKIYRTLAIARFCRILGTLLKNGVPILNSLRIGKDAMGNRILSDAVTRASENVSAGKTLAQPLRQCGEFPEETVEMIAVAEEANNLEQVLVDIADGMETRTTRQLDLFVRMIEPVMLVLMGAVVAFVMAGLLLPILQSSSVL